MLLLQIYLYLQYSDEDLSEPLPPVAPPSKLAQGEMEDGLRGCHHLLLIVQSEHMALQCGLEGK